jgi:hypothetical protein
MVFDFMEVDKEELDRLQGGMKVSFLKMDLGRKWPRLSSISLSGYWQHDRSENRVSWESWTRYKSEDEQSEDEQSEDEQPEDEQSEDEQSEDEQSEDEQSDESDASGSMYGTFFNY